MAQGSEFLALIKIAVDNARANKSLDDTSKQLDNLSGKEVQFPSFEKIPQQLQPGTQALGNLTKELDGFTQGLSKSIPILDKTGNIVGTKLVTSFTNTAGVTKQLTTIFGENNQINKQFISQTAQSAGAMNDFQRALARVIVVAPIWMAFRAVLQTTLQIIGEQIQFLKDLDTAMARIMIVGKGTKEEYEGLKNTLISLSVTYGTLASEALKASVIFAQQGRTVEETIKLTRTAMIASQVLGEDITTTVNNLTAAIESFGIPIDDAISIIDKFINVEKQFAVTSKDLADATKVAGATANQLGISINAFLGDVTAAIEVTRKSGSEAARALQFIYARLLTTGAKSLTQVAKIPIFLNDSKEATFALTNTYRSSTDVLDELAGKWDTLTNKEKLSIAQNVASKRQLTVFMALMQNYNASLNARIAALSAAGKAESAFGIIQDTVEIKMKRLSASWNNLTASVADTSAWKEMLDTFSNIIVAVADTVNEQQRLKRIGTEQQDIVNKEFETQKSQIKNLKELIQLRNEYLTRPPTDRNQEMLKKINSAITSVQDSGKVFIDVEGADTIEKLDTLARKVAERQIRTNVNIDFETKEKVLNEKLKEAIGVDKGTFLSITSQLGLVEGIKFLTQTGKRQKEIKNIQQELNNLTADKNAKLSQGLAKLTEEEAKLRATREFREAEANIANTLLDEDTEILEINNRINIEKEKGLLSAKELIDLEIQLVKASNFTFDDYQRRLEVKKLELKQTEAIVAEEEKLRNNYRSLAMDYEKANKTDKERIKRVAELLRMSPKDIVEQFKTDAFDKKVITDYWNYFSDQAKKAIEDSVLELNTEFPSLKHPDEILLETLNRIQQMVGSSGAGLVAPGSALSSANPPAILGQEVLNNTTINIANIEGAITNNDIANILSTIETKLKGLTNYISNEQLNQIVQKIDEDLANPNSQIGRTDRKNIENH